MLTDVLHDSLNDRLLSCKTKVAHLSTYAVSHNRGDMCGRGVNHVVNSERSALESYCLPEIRNSQNGKPHKAKFKDERRIKRSQTFVDLI